MNAASFLTQASGSGGGGMSLVVTLGYFVIIIGLFYFIAIRPQKKEQKKHAALVSTLEAGDSILTSSGFYGVVIDVMDDIVIVEFGNNKNCRIPMKRDAVAEVEKPNAE